MHAPTDPPSAVTTSWSFVSPRSGVGIRIVIAIGKSLVVSI